MNLLIDFVQIMYFVGLILTIINYYFDKSLISFFLLIYFESSIISDIISLLFISWYKHNYIVIQYFDLIYYPITVIIILTQLESKKSRTILLFTALSYVIFTLTLNNIIGQLKYPSVAETIGAILIFTSSLMYYREIFINENNDNLSQNGKFWIISSIFLYTSGAFFLNLVYTNLNVNNIPVWYNHLNVILFYFTSFVIFIGLILTITKKTNTTNELKSNV